MKRKFKLLLLITIIFITTACNKETQVDTTDTNQEDIVNQKYETLNIDFLKVGKADAIIISQNSHAIIIDTGEDDDAKKVIEHLKQNNINEIDAMIITHFDKDHVGGADKILDNYHINNIFVPDYKGHHEEYLEFLETVIDKELKTTKITEDYDFSFGDATLTIEPTKLYTNDSNVTENDNNHSLITTLRHGKNTFLFMGDAQKERLEEWVDKNEGIHYDLIKIPHHGVYDKALKDLFTSTTAQYAVLTDSNKNPAD